jgi:hypothetical protein
MHDDHRDEDDDGVEIADEHPAGGLRGALTRSWLAWIFVLLAIGFIGWYIRTQPLQDKATTMDVVIHVLQLVPSVCAILVPAALLARHPDAQDRASTLLAGTILFALVQGFVVLADPFQELFLTITPADPALAGVVPLQAVYSAVISVVAALALGAMAVGLSQARQSEDRIPGWLTGWLVPAVTILGAVVGVLAAQRYYGDVPASPALAIYLGATVILGVVRLIVWAWLLTVTARGVMAGEVPPGGWLLATLGAAAVLASLVLVNLTGAIDLPSEDVATWLGYVIVVGYAAGNVILLLAFALGLPELPDDDEDDLDIEPVAVMGRARR